MSSPKVIILASGTTWVVPTDWNSANNSISCIGAGGGGTNGSNSADGGGGGAFAQSTNVSLTPGATVDIVIGQGGTGAGSSGTAGGDTVFGGTALTSCLVGAQGGQGGSGSGSGPGGSAAASVGHLVYDGGTGGGGPYGPSGGGGAGGPNGPGGAGGAGPQSQAATPGSAGGGGGGGGSAGAAAASTTVGGAGGNNYAGTGGGSGGTSTSQTGGAGSAGGGGGGGYPQAAVSGGAGGNGTDLPGGTAGSGGGGGGAGWETGAYQGGNGGLYGGGGGSDSYGGTGGTGAQGVIVIEYTPAPAEYTIVLASGTTWVVPENWNSADNSISCIGAGGGGTNGSSSADGGGGGAYAQSSNVNLTPGAVINIVIGQGGVGTGAAGTAGGDTIFGGTSLTSCIVGAQGGQGGSGSGSGPGGSTAASVGQIVFAGGNGGGGPYGPAGGGGAGGPNGGGGNGGAGPQSSAATPGSAGGGGGGGGSAGSAASSTTAGGAGGSNYAGVGGGTGGTSASPAGAAGSVGGGGGGGYPQAAISGGAGGNGNDLPGGTAGSGGGGGGAGWQTGAYQGGNGGLYGGGGGSDSYGGTGGTGAQGVIVITYTTTGTTTNSVTATAGGGTLSATGYTPSTLGPAYAEVGLGSVSTTGFRPLVGAIIDIGLGHVGTEGFAPNAGASNYPRAGIGRLSLDGQQIIQHSATITPVSGLRLSGLPAGAAAGTGYVVTAGTAIARLVSPPQGPAGHLDNATANVSTGHLAIAGKAPSAFGGHVVSVRSGHLTTTGRKANAYLNVMSVPVQTGRMDIFSTASVAVSIVATVDALPLSGRLSASSRSPSTATDNSLTVGQGNAHLTGRLGGPAGVGIGRVPVPGRLSLDGKSPALLVEVAAVAKRGTLNATGNPVKEDLTVHIAAGAGHLTTSAKSIVANVAGLAAVPLAHLHLAGAAPAPQVEARPIPRTGFLIPSGQRPVLTASAVIREIGGHLTATGEEATGRLSIAAEVAAGHLHVAEQIALGHASATAFPGLTIADFITGAAHPSVADVPTPAGIGRLHFDGALPPKLRADVDPEAITAHSHLHSDQQIPHVGSSGFTDLGGMHLAGLKTSVTISASASVLRADLHATGLLPTARTITFPAVGRIGSFGDVPTPFTSATVHVIAETGQLNATGIRPALVGYTIVLGQGLMNLGGLPCASIVYGRPYPAGQYVLGEPEITTVTGC